MWKAWQYVCPRHLHLIILTGCHFVSFACFFTSWICEIDFEWLCCCVSERYCVYWSRIALPIVVLGPLQTRMLVVICMDLSHSCLTSASFQNNTWDYGKGVQDLTYAADWPTLRPRWNGFLLFEYIVVAACFILRVTECRIFYCNGMSAMLKWIYGFGVKKLRLCFSGIWIVVDF
jgi:hypothetical protein